MIRENRSTNLSFSGAPWLSILKCFFKDKELNNTPKTEEKLWTRCFGTILISHFTFYLGFYMLAPTLPLYIKSLGGRQCDQLFVSSFFRMSRRMMPITVEISCRPKVTAIA